MIRKVAYALLFLACVAASGGSSYWQNWRDRQNPFYPFNLKIGERVLLRGIGDELYNIGNFPWHHVPDDLQERLDDNHWKTVFGSCFDPNLIVTQDVKIGGWGPVFGVICVPAVLFAFMWAARREDWAMIWFLLAMIVPYVLFPQHTWGRFLLPVIPAGLVSLSYVLERMKR